MASQFRNRIRLQHTVFDRVAHCLVQYAENVVGGLSGELLVLQRLAKVLAPERSELVDSEIAECRFEMKTDDTSDGPVLDGFRGLNIDPTKTSRLLHRR